MLLLTTIHRMIRTITMIYFSFTTYTFWQHSAPLTNVLTAFTSFLAFALLGSLWDADDGCYISSSEWEGLDRPSKLMFSHRLYSSSTGTPSKLSYLSNWFLRWYSIAFFYFISISFWVDLFSRLPLLAAKVGSLSQTYACGRSECIKTFILKQMKYDSWDIV